MWVVLYNMGGYELQSCSYDVKADAEWLLGYVRTKEQHRWSKLVPLTAVGLAEHFA